ncbi:MAG: hypothetical protein H6985_03090 [Pseudomonadales bacterium]|nr:hypothetical protein [Pseudomonadales bacterium]
MPLDLGAIAAEMFKACSSIVDTTTIFTEASVEFAGWIDAHVIPHLCIHIYTILNPVTGVA